MLTAKTSAYPVITQPDCASETPNSSWIKGIATLTMVFVNTETKSAEIMTARRSLGLIVSRPPSPALSRSEIFLAPSRWRPLQHQVYRKHEPVNLPLAWKKSPREPSSRSVNRSLDVFVRSHANSISAERGVPDHFLKGDHRALLRDFAIVLAG